MKTQVTKTQHRIRTAAAILGVAAFFNCQLLWAEGSDSGYELSFVSSAAHGDLMEDGRYRLVIHLLSGSEHDPLAKMTNLCVSRIMIGEHRKARRDCNRAVEAAEQAANAAPENEREDHYKNWAVALSNRGVLRAIRKQQGAAEDFRQAMELHVYSETATRNLARFHDTELEPVASR